MADTHYDRYLVTYAAENGKITTYGFVIPNHYGHTFRNYRELIAEAKKAFPRLNVDKVECLTVIASRWCKGSPMIRFKAPAGTTAREGWQVFKERLPDVAWH